MGKPLNPHITGSSKLHHFLHSQINKNKRKKKKKERECECWRGHVIANVNEGDAVGSGADEAEESVAVVNIGGVEERRHRFGESAHRRNHEFSGNAAEVLRPRRPLHRPWHCRRRHGRERNSTNKFWFSLRWLNKNWANDSESDVLKACSRSTLLLLPVLHKSSHRNICQDCDRLTTLHSNDISLCLN